MRLIVGVASYVRSGHRRPGRDSVISVRKVVSDEKLVSPIHLCKSKFKPASSGTVRIIEACSLIIALHTTTRMGELRNLATHLVAVVGVGIEARHPGCEACLLVAIQGAEIPLCGIE